MPFYIKNLCTGLVLDIPGAGNDEGSPTIMYRPLNQSKAKHQLWDYKDGMIISEANGLVLGVKKDKMNVVILQPKTEGYKLWTFEYDNSIKLMGALDDRYAMDIENRDLNESKTAVVAEVHGGVTQQFKILPA